MNRFQNVNFRSLEDFFDYLPENEALIVESLRKLILETVPEPIEKLNYNVPYYRRYKNICFVWPGSVPWGGIKEGVQLGFVQGYLLADEEKYLAAGKRKFVRMRTFYEPKDIDHQRIRSLLLEAVLIDDESRRAANKKNKFNH